MAQKFKSTGTLTMAQAGANNTVIAAPNPSSVNGFTQEHFIRRIYAERVDSTDVTLIFQNNANPVRELLPRITLNSDKGAVWLEFDDKTEIGVGGGLALIVDASVGNKAKVWVEYLTSSAQTWPS